MRYVMIGNSAAAVGCVEGIRQLDRSGPITVIASEPYHTYSRPLISSLLWGKTTEERMKYRPDSFYSDNGCTAMLGRTALKIDPEEKQVLLDGGEKVPYDKLLIATGSRPFVPPIEGLDGVQNQYTFLSLDDAKALEKALTPQSRVLVVGAGLVGLKCVEGIRDRVGEVTVVDLADRILPSVLDETGAAMVQRHIESHGVRFLLGDSVAAFEGNTARLKSGGLVDFDILVVAVGVRPNTELVKEAGGLVRKGIVIDEYGRTSLPEVYAAGDCTESRDITIDQDRILALLPAAYMQGESAGIHMAAGGEHPYNKAIPMNAAGFFGLHMITAGSYVGEDKVIAEEGSYKRLFYKDGVLKGYILIGNVERAGIYTALIRERTPLSSIDFGLIQEKPQLMAFSRKDRAAVLSRQV